MSVCIKVYIRSISHHHENDFSGLDATHFSHINQSLELKCLIDKENDKLIHYKDDDYCPIEFDKLLCWPRTPPDTYSILPCFSELLGVPYDTSHNATKYCNINGVWDSLSNYDDCLHIATPNRSCNDVDFDIRCSTYLASIVYYVGYSISLIALVLAVIVFINFKDLRCLRNTIHINLFFTYILSIIIWILSLTLHLNIVPSTVGCVFLAIFFHYFSLTNFCWMLVEGLYLYMLVVQTFSGNDNIRFNLYALIGWGFPAVFVVIWSVCKAFTLEFDVVSTGTSAMASKHMMCTWMRESYLDWIIQIPECIAIIINLIFLIKIMWVLITKLRSANTVETRQYRKASKALLVLIPLLGITYLIVISGPNEGMESHVFAILQAFLLSIQGLSVAMFYCFLNSEVRSALKHRYHRWRDERNLNSENATKLCTISGEWENVANYEKCIPTANNIGPDSEHTTIIYCTGYSISMVALLLAVIVFLYFKELRCLRNTIHTNLFFTYIMSSLLWILTLFFQVSSQPGLTECIVLLTLLHYFNLTNFFWMMVEGLYLYMLVVETFSRTEHCKFAIYAAIGYGKFISYSYLLFT
ncbi:unnamed protein product [Diamesa serratosioi]